jgi:hypothetical protein
VVADNRKAHNTTTCGWEIVKNGIPRGSIVGPLFFLLYINDFPKIPTNKAKIILYVDYTNVITRSFKLALKICLLSNSFIPQMNILTDVITTYDFTHNSHTF